MMASPARPMAELAECWGQLSAECALAATYHKAAVLLGGDEVLIGRTVPARSAMNIPLAQARARARARVPVVGTSRFCTHATPSLRRLNAGLLQALPPAAPGRQGGAGQLPRAGESATVAQVVISRFEHRFQVAAARGDPEVLGCVIDMSTNGSFLNGEKLEKGEVRPRPRVGTLALRLLLTHLC